jgi:hypothetical protein
MMPPLPAALPPGGVRIPSRAPGINFLRYPTSIAPPDGTLAGLVGPNNERTGAVWRDGTWQHNNGKPVRWEPVFWLVLDLER